uniref:G-protein coupled receptors family 1 profile domain-containing protein n=1 Tax=Plectus sambesii TaxID=2011161 RepID=A0A914W8T7_9BILA
MAENRSVPIDFYGERAYWFTIVTGIFGLDIFISNLMLLWIAASAEEIRSVTANLFTINLALGNALVGSFYAFFQPFVLIFGANHPILCEICGMGNIMFAMSFLYTPTLMAACRFYTVTRLPSSSYNKLISLAFFTKSGAVTLLIICWSYGLLFCSILLYNGQLGEDPNGFCAAKAFTSVVLYIFYNMGLIIFALITGITTFIYYRRLRQVCR